MQKLPFRNSSALIHIMNNEMDSISSGYSIYYNLYIVIHLPNKMFVNLLSVMTFKLIA